MDEVASKRSKLTRLFNNKKAEANDGDIENFYSSDPSNISYLQLSRQAGPN